MSDTADKPEPPHWLDPPRWWRRIRPLRWVLAAVAGAWIAYALGWLDRLAWKDRTLPELLSVGTHPDQGLYTKVAVGVRLVDSFRSYADVVATTATLENQGYSDYSLATRRAPDSSRYPMYRFDTLRVPEYRHLDSPGELTLQFFNDRLFEAEFVPTEPERYARKIRALGLQRQANARAEKIDGHLRIASTVDLAISQVGRHLRSRAYVLWQDLRLVDERTQWDEAYGAIPKRIVDQ